MGKKGKSANKYRKVEISHENIKRENLKAYKGIIFFSLILLTIVIGTSYALFSTVRTSKKTVEVEAGTFKISFLDSNYINLENTYPMTDEEGLNTSAYKFTITNNGTLNGKYNISLEESSENTLDKSYIKYSIKEGDGTWSTPALLSNGIILTDNKQLNSSDHVDYELKLWLDESAPNEVQGTKYQAKIVVSATQTNANIINVAQPIINLNGTSVMNIEQNASFTDPGVSSIQAKEEIDVSAVTKRYEYFDGVNTTTVEALDTSKVGTYFIYYEVSDSSENKGLAIRIVNVYKIDTTPPTITVVGETSMTLDYGVEYTDQGAIAQDDIDGDLTSKIIVVGEVNTQKEGTRVIKYLIIDSEGNTASAIRTVYVRGKYADASGDLVIDNVNSTPAKQLVLINVISDYLPLTFVISSNEDTPNDSDYKTIEELQNEGLAENGKLVFTKNGNYVVWIKDAEGNVQKRNISIDGIDTTKPTCKFSERLYTDMFDDFTQDEIAGIQQTFLGKGIEKEITLDCYDIVDINEVYLTDQILRVTNPDVLQIVNIEKVRLREPTDTGYNMGYKYTITLKGLKAGTSKLVLPEGIISDKVGNMNDEVTTPYDITVSELDVENSEMELVLGGEESKKIEVQGTNLFERFIYRNSNEEVVTVDSTGVMTAVAPGKATITVIDPQSGAKKEVNVTVTAQINFMGGEGVQALSTNRLTCTLNDSMECVVTLPTFEAKPEYSALGWNTDGSEGVAIYSQGETIKVTGSATYYAIAVKAQNESIKAAYTYNQVAAVGEAGRCITGDEATCQQNNCIESRTKGSCPVGTIIKYAVNDSEDKVFYVLHDDGRTMTLQQRENTIKSQWYSEGNDNTKGPITALQNLEQATDGWTNVSNQKYTMGTTNFLANSPFADKIYSSQYTKCQAAGSGSGFTDVALCTMTDGYTLEERTAKARFITVQETRVTGCGYDQDKATCPIWMYNYLDNSIGNGGTQNDSSSSTGSNGYHLMSAFTSSQHNWWMMTNGVLSQAETGWGIGVRAVIVIDK